MHNILIYIYIHISDITTTNAGKSPPHILPTAPTFQWLSLENEEYNINIDAV